MVAQNTRFLALSAHLRTRSAPKRDADRAETRSETARFFACIAHLKRTSDRAQTRSETARFFAQPCVDVPSLPPLRSRNRPFRQPPLHPDVERPIENCALFPPAVRRRAVPAPLRLIFASARHQVAPQNALKAAPKLRGFAVCVHLSPPKGVSCLRPKD